MKAHVFITLKAGVLDAQGKATENALTHLGFTNVTSVRLGKFIELELSSSDTTTVQQEVSQMCEALLANTVIESYRIELIKDAA